MSWSRYLQHNRLTWYSLWDGLYTRAPVADIPHNPRKGESYLYQANDVWGPRTSRVINTRPGFTKVRSTAIDAAGTFTGMVHLDQIADEFLVWVNIAGTSHKPYRDNANPPGAIAGGTDFTQGHDNLVSSVLFNDGTNQVAICMSRLRDLPQSFTSAVTRANNTISGGGITSLKPGFGEVFGQRLLLGDVNVDGTVYIDRVYFTDLRNGKTISDALQFFSFETTQQDQVRALHKLSDVCLVGKMNNVFLLATTPTATKPFAVRELPAGRFRGPVSHQAVVEADNRLFWIGQTNLHSLDLNGQVHDLGDAIKPTIDGLSDARRIYTVAGVDPVNNMILFNVANSGQSTNQLCIALNYKTKALYLWTTTRNAYANRQVSSQTRLIGGGEVGLFYNELTGTAGNADDATALIDADVFTPRFWRAYGTKQKIPFVLVSMDPIGSEKLTVQFRIDDDTSWTTPSESPITVTGTDNLTKLIHLDTFAERIQLRFRNNTLNESYSLKAVGLPFLPLQPVGA